MENIDPRTFTQSKKSKIFDEIVNVIIQFTPKFI